MRCSVIIIAAMWLTIEKFVSKSKYNPITTATIKFIC